MNVLIMSYNAPLVLYNYGYKQGSLHHPEPWVVFSAGDRKKRGGPSPYTPANTEIHLEN